jgi:predicted dehydrogenase/threonine dehydrogenase-like Zn-dependent dehydrogenase
MKQLLQDARTGDLSVTEVAAPQLLPGCVLVRTAASLVSAGTERASAEFARKSLLAKGKARPDLVRDVLAKLKRDGLASTIGTVRSRLDQPQSVGYSSAGTVIAVGDGVSDIGVGDRIACAGAGYAVHAELACVPRLLVAKIPSEAHGNIHAVTAADAADVCSPLFPVSFEEAAFATVGAICLHGIRTAEVSLGETIAVIGLGLLGQITVLLLKAAGCRVFGMDLIEQRTALAIQSGAEAASTRPGEFRDLCFQKTGGQGADAVLITAETPSSDPVNLAAEVARDRAIVVAVGTVGMELQRKQYYEKELDFRISRSYGPGRYDAAYEQKGRDYPIGQVRWTETRNMEVFLRFIAEGKLDLCSLITHRFPIEQANRAYEQIMGRTSEPSLAVLLTYPNAGSSAAPDGSESRFVAASAIASAQIVSRDSSPERAAKCSPALQRVELREEEINSWSDEHAPTSPSSRGRTPAVFGVLGAGNFAQSTLLPALKLIPGVSFIAVCNATSPRARSAAEKFGFSNGSTSEEQILHDPRINTILIATRHHLHASQTISALNSCKNVFCEKPLCLSEAELAAIVRVMSRFGPASEQTPPPTPMLMVGFNRRFAPMSARLKTFVDEIHEPIFMHYRVNAGFLPSDHWTNDPEQGGGRILGEVCHFVDFLCFLAGAYPIEVQAQSVGNAGHYSMDNIVAQLRFPNGSLGTITYMANGDKSASKERLEVFGGASVAILEDFRRLELIRNGRKQLVRARLRQDKGHKAEMQAFVDAVAGTTPPPIPFEQIMGSTLATLRLQNACQTGQPLPVDLSEFVAAALQEESHSE